MFEALHEPEKETKVIVSFTISPALNEAAARLSIANNISKSEIAEYALRKLLSMETDTCKGILNKIFK